MELWELSAVDIADGVRAGRIRAADAVDTTLDRIDRLNGPLNAFVHVDADRARRVAADIDRRVAAGDDPGPLAGVPLGVKELEAVEGWPDTRASTVFRDRIATTTSTMTTRLLGAGAVPIGLTAAPEMGLLFFTNSVLHGPTRNPWNLERTPGGSSGGAGAALAAGLVPLATGSDMGGSIRLPSGWCGVIGVKGTFGRIPRGPGYLGGANLVHYGPLARSVRDAARYLDCAVGVDQRDPSSLPPPPVPFERAIDEIDLTGVRLAVVDDTGTCPTDPEVRAALHATAEALVEGARMTRVDGVDLPVPPMDEIGGALLYVDLDPGLGDGLAQIMANMMSTEGAGPLFEVAFDPAVLSLDGVAKANQFRYQFNATLAAAFDRVDLLLVPTSPVPAFGATGPVPTVVDGKDVGPTAAAVYTGVFNMSGNPCVSVPAGFADGCPVGMQIVARRHEDALALAAAAAVERITPWPKTAPYAAGGPATGG
jgi:aspartyl-tRNA(Asn)/glutamyl-tRNA(Gln) amidotransferase subunit A